jgi:hypothetical protein
LVFTHLKRLKMAKVKFSALISEMRNKLNGSVFSRNRGGAYLRNKVTPLNPQTAAQVEARSLLAQFSQGWRSLTQVQRDAWSAAVSNWTTTDVFGDSVKPTGATLYIRLNINISIAGGTPINTPPAPLGVVALESLSLEAAVTGDLFEIGFTAAPVPAGHAMVVESTACLSPGISNANSQFRFISLLSATSASPADAYPEQAAKFGDLVAGQKVFVRAKMIRLATGETSQKLVASKIVGA